MADETQSTNTAFHPTNLRPGTIGGYNIPVHSADDELNVADLNLTWDLVVAKVRELTYQGKIDPSKAFPAPALVYESWKALPKITSWAHHQSVNLSTSPVELVHVKAKVLEYNTFLPGGVEYITPQKRQESPYWKPNDHMVNLMTDEFISLDPQMRLPRVGTLVIVDFRDKMAGTPYTAGELKEITQDGTYISLKKETNPQEIFDSAKDDDNSGVLEQDENTGESLGHPHAAREPHRQRGANSGKRGRRATSKLLPLKSLRKTSRQKNRRDQKLVLNSKNFPEKKELFVDKRLDYSGISKYNIMPYSKTSKVIETGRRKGKEIFYLPANVPLDIRQNTSLIVIHETNGSYIRPYSPNKTGKNNFIHYGIVMNSDKNGEHKEVLPLTSKKRMCTIRMNMPFGLSGGHHADKLSPISVSVAVSSPVTPHTYMKKLEGGKPLEEHMSEWLSSRALPDGAEPFIMGPWGTPGLRTGPSPDQSLSLMFDPSVLERGKLSFVKGGHYILPHPSQADALYTLISSLINSPPTSPYSWGMKYHDKHNVQLSWNFPAVGGGPPSNKHSHFYTKERGKYRISANGFPWGKVGDHRARKTCSGYMSWWTGEKETGMRLKDIFKSPGNMKGRHRGIVSRSRWCGTGGTFLEYYVLARFNGLTHKEAWYVTIAAAAMAYPKKFGGVGLGPSPLPTTKHVNEMLAEGQKRWYAATKWVREMKPTTSEYVTAIAGMPYTNWKKGEEK